ncbi:MetQ/NlpA family ABC transporter substrate-binding protein [Lactiplantibacillus fabifermentans]|uniref:D-methionine abc transporter, substrate binding protein n=2 Tax=Lactiplantibacillus fabifermentans TaxID=483011 RepID=A0A0R2NWR5_9LACO|nr:MetQ/NlpA family ABC transporter substrate-binding protein [Lactiplantibacillus fabifermentans]ETY72738.1 metal ABC transporter substrate-binding protein [Lactiplantibacillus fabifermentans T30PCM01]KRO27434.1 d-methionine abc transporter, substrate binding protein [Lactiplantibacillus fabifermentans DSM 21115]
MKKLLWWILGIAVVVGVVFGIHGLSSSHNASASHTDTITIGSQGSDYDIWQHIAKSADAKKLGLKITVKQITDGVQLNKATAQGSVDVNAFQSWSYYEAYNQENPKSKLASLGTTYLEPMGIYSKKYKSVKAIPDGATIAIANNPSQAARGLLLLQKAGLITLKKNFGSLGTVKDIKSNPKHLKFKEIDDTTGPRIIKNVDAVLISNTVALEGHLHVLTDSIFHEKVDQSTKDNINILATAAKNKNKASYKKLIKLYHRADIQKYIKDKYYGTKIEVNKPNSYFKN